MSLRLTSLGGVSLLDASGNTPRRLSKGHALALLLYLVCHSGRRCERETLRELIWGDRSRADGSRSLRQALWVLRDTLPNGAVQADASEVTYLGGVESDITDFEQALRRGDTERAVALYRGPFLSGFPRLASRAFGQWAEEQRQSLHRAFRKAALRAVDRAVGQGSWAAAIALLDRLVEANPVDTEVRLRRIEVLSLAGRIDDAIDETGQLEAEVDHDELPDTAQALFGRIRHSARADREDADSHHELQRLPLIGRGGEYEQLIAPWRRAQDGNGSAAFVTGDPRIGKTHLIAEFVRQAGLDGAAILRGRSYATEQSLRFGAMIDVVRAAVQIPGFAGVAPAWIAELARLVPDVLQAYPAAQAATPESSGRHWSFEACAEVFQALSDEQAVVCVLEDFHLADADTVELAHYLVRRLGKRAVLFLFEIRLGDASDAVLGMTRRLVEDHAAIQIDVGPLSREGCVGLISVIAEGADVAGTVVDYIVRQSQGHPGFLLAEFDALAAEGAVLSNGTTVRFEPQRIESDAPIGARARSLAEEWLGVLSPGARRILESAAVQGDVFSARTIAHVSGVTMEQTAEALRELARRRIVQWNDGEQGDRCFFTYRQIRSAVLYAIPPFQRQEMLRALERVRTAGAQPERPLSIGGGAVGAPTHSLTRNARLGWRRLSVGSLAVVMFSLALFALHRVRTRDAATLPPLPTGLLVFVDGPDQKGFAILDPDQPRKPLVRLPASQLVMPSEWHDAAPLLLSPDASRIAFALSRGTQGPDVFVMRRDGSDTLHLVRGRSDDVPLSWAPDGSTLLIKTLGLSDTLYSFFQLAAVPGNGSAPRVFGPEPFVSDEAAWSPDGSRLAVIRRREESQLWLMNADGSNALRVTHDSLVESARPTWSPDASKVAFSATRGGELGLYVASADGIGLRKVATLSGSEGRFAWDSASARIFFTSERDRNAEVFSVRHDGLELVRLTYTPVAEYVVGFLNGVVRPYLDSVVILGAPRDTLSIGIGDTVSLNGALRDSRGGSPSNLGTVRWRCLPVATCRMNGSTMHAIAPGSAFIVADVGGWRADTLPVWVVDVTPSLVLQETWESGLDTTAWRSFGVPTPMVTAGTGWDGSRGFESRGDATWESGVVSVRDFDTTRGVAVEVYGRAEFTRGWPSWERFQVALSGEDLGAFGGDRQNPSGDVLLDISRLSADQAPRLWFANNLVPTPAKWNPATWHSYVIQWIPEGRYELWIDGELQWQSRAVAPLAQRVRLLLAGRATAGAMVHDDVKVFEGLRYR